MRSQDAPFLIRAMLGTVYARGLAWDFVKEHWEAMARHVPGQRVPAAVGGRDRPREPGVGARRERLLHGNKIALGGKTLEQYLEQLRVAVSFQEREAAALQAYLGRLKR